ncbi:MAG: molybdopterin-dependent oxidoreductase [Pseudomonadota bacterium]
MSSDTTSNSPTVLDNDATQSVVFEVNGAPTEIEAHATDVLVDTLRDQLGLTGTHVGCDTGQCGACTIHLNGQSVKACTVLTQQVAGAQLTTIEGVASGMDLHPVQQAFQAEHGLQCGFCTPGMVMRAIDLLEKNPTPTDEEIRSGLRGNYCRCTGYQNIIRAIQCAAKGTTAEQDLSGTVGTSPPRREDRRFLTGQGHYTADTSFAGQAHAVFVRSSEAHAILDAVSVDQAKESPSVLDVFTGEDIADDQVSGLTSSWQIMSRDGTPMKAVYRSLLAHDRVRFVGEAIALVVATTKRAANVAAAKIEVRTRPLPAVVDPTNAGNMPALHEVAPDNKCYEWAFGDEAAIDRDLDEAAHVTQIKLSNNRLIPNALEPRAANAIFDPGSEKYTLYTTSQNPHMARKTIAEILNLDAETDLHVISPDVGGGFGSKIFIYPEECLCLWAAKRLGVPVKWVATRTESFQADAHGRDHNTVASLGLDSDGQFVALKVENTANLGAYLSSFSTFVPSFLYATMLAGPYTTKSVFCAVDAVFTNTAPVDAYRGAGRPEATYLIETLIDKAAGELGIDPIDLRRRNLIPADAFPYMTPVGLQYDVGDYHQHLDLALERADHSNFASRRAESLQHGKLRGFGISCYVEACGIAPSYLAGALGANIGLWEAATLRFSLDGHLQILTGSHAHGQGHETSFAQLAAETLGLAFQDVEVIHGDTERCPVGIGTFGSRSLVVGGSAVVRAAEKVIDKGKHIAAHILKCAPDDIAFEKPDYVDRSSGRRRTILDIIRAAYTAHDLPAGLSPGLEETVLYDPVNFTFPSGTHVCEVEIDPSTGALAIQQFVAIDDFGRQVHPKIVEGQVHGGVAQGIGQALFEHAEYDAETGALLSGSFRTYAFPKADQLPDIETGSTMTLCPHTPMGGKGAGEAGAIAAPPAVMNAITDAIGTRLEMPATQEKIWSACRKLAPGETS